ncbi:hypothetical protein Hanom_Chr12g01158511 [Helianthus anomalus]
MDHWFESLDRRMTGGSMRASQSSDRFVVSLKELKRKSMTMVGGGDRRRTRGSRQDVLEFGKKRCLLKIWVRSG